MLCRGSALPRALGPRWSDGGTGGRIRGPWPLPRRRMVAIPVPPAFLVAALILALPGCRPEPAPPSGGPPVASAPDSGQEPAANASAAAATPAVPAPAADPQGSAAADDPAACLAALRARLPDVLGEGSRFHAVIEPPFVVLGDGGRAAVERSAAHTVRWAVRLLEQDFFARRPRQVLAIWLFDGADSYRRHARQIFGDIPSTPYGYYSSRHGALIMNIQTGGGTLVHEIVHPYVEADFPRCPAWLNEGLGSLFEQCHEVEGHIRGLTNWRLQGLQEAIREQRMVRLSALVATGTDEFYGPGSGLHYAMARYLLYWLQEQDRLRDFYRAFRQGVGDDPTGATHLRAALGVTDLDAFQPDWERWVLTLRQ